MMDRRQLKQEGKNLVKKDVLKYFCILFVYGFLYSSIETFFERISKATGNDFYNSLSILVLLLAPMSIGCTYVFLSTVRQKDYTIRFGDIFKYYKGMEGIIDIIAVSFLSSVIVTVGFVLLIVPGIIWSIDLSQCKYILALSPDKDPFEVMKESRSLMKKRRGEYFMLVLSYIPHILLGVLTLGIYFIWLSPYMASTFALYFDRITTPETEVEESLIAGAVEKDSALEENTEKEQNEENDEESNDDITF